MPAATGRTHLRGPRLLASSGFLRRVRTAPPSCSRPKTMSCTPKMIDKAKTERSGQTSATMPNAIHETPNNRSAIHSSPRQITAWKTLTAPAMMSAAAVQTTSTVIVKAGMASTRTPPRIQAVRAHQVNARRDFEWLVSAGMSAFTNMPYAIRTTSAPSEAKGRNTSSAPLASARTPTVIRNAGLRVQFHALALGNRRRTLLNADATIRRLQARARRGTRRPSQARR